ncbi:breast cancer type 1 susceptibility protein homolog isoform X2 [Neoarius graeffei]|nr:breast cancer type 1 susceptibility protein homolog isoform X2 [Neoarius graeffei]
MTKLLERNKRKETSCPVCKTKITKRSLQESPGFQKLVEGLQNLVRSYEFDTCTNYFTGLPQRRQRASVETESRDQQGSEENTTSEGDATEKEATVSSTTAAKDAFAKLMCLEDSCPATSQQDCLDSSVGDLPQKSKTKPAHPEDVPPTTEAGNSQTQQDVTPDDGKRSRRRSKRLCLEPDRIMDTRQKKSVQKVSEWLLKISPTSGAQTEDNVEGALPTFTDSDAEKESTASRASTEIHDSANDKAVANPEREVPCRGLEEQVFGAVYKRERKVVKITKVTKSFPLERETAPVSRSENLLEKDEKIMTSKRRSSRNATPADSIRKSSKEDKEDGVHQEEVEKESKQENGTKPLRSSDEQEKVVQPGPDEEGEIMEVSPAFEVPLKKPGRRSKMQEVWQDVDLDLTEKENNMDNKKDRKRRIARSRRDPAKDDKLEKGKNAKSLVIVSAGTEIVDSKEKVPCNPRLIETEVNIESYPSTAEPKSPDARKTRRSLRLQEFTAEVQGLPRRRRSKQALPKPADEPENNPATTLDEPSTKADHVGTNQPNTSQNKKPGRSGRGNGCVYSDDFENIEIMQSSEDAAAPKCVSEGTIAEENSLVSVVPDTGDQDKNIIPCPTKVVNTSPLAALVPESIPQKCQESPSAKTSASAVEHKDTEQEDDTNDSELDTEQLMKTFKTTKRKSFYLGSPRLSHSRTQEKSLTRILEEDKQDNVTQAEIPGMSPDSDQVLPSNACERAPHEITSQTCVAEVASVRLLQVKSPPLPSLPKDTPKDNSIKVSGASDHPEKTVKSQDSSRSQDSSPPVNLDLAHSIQLFSTSVTQEEPQISGSKDSSKSPTSSELQGTRLQANFDVDSNKISSIQLGNMTNCETLCGNFESSVTPDGLVPNGPEAVVTEPATTQNLDKMDEGEVLSQPCLRRKRKAQRLESSESESSIENEDFPPLAQIFKFHHSSSPSAKDPAKNSLNQDDLQAEERSPKPGLDSASQDSRSRSEPEAQSSPASQGVAPYQKQESSEDVNSNDVQDDGVPDLTCRDEWITSSQGSVDLFGTPQESEEVVEGVCGNTRLSIESSQFSSEIITTQQREEMQQELHRLERMMALVSEAIQKKDADLDDKNKTEDDNQHSGQQGRVRSQQSCKSGRQVEGQRAVPEDATVEKKLNELRGETLGERSLRNECRTESGGGMELVASGLSATEQGLVKKFARKMKAGVSNQVTPTTTHIIIKTGEDMVCERTLKYFQGIAGRKWVVSFLWISECFKHGKLLAEAPYEVCGDVVNGRYHNGPRKARTAPDDDLLMKGCEICFQGSFTDMTTDQMEAMVELCGATVMKDPLMFSRKGICYHLVVVQPDPDDSQSYYTALQKKATVVTRSWLLDSIATYTLQNPHDYNP